MFLAGKSLLLACKPRSVYYKTVMVTEIFRKQSIRLVVTAFLVSFLLFFVPTTFGQSIDELRQKIEETNRVKAALEKEIAQYQSDLSVIGKEAQTLANAVKTLDLERKKLLADVKLTENKIQATELTITELLSGIRTKESQINMNHAAIRLSVREQNELDQVTILSAMLGYDTFSEMWNETEELLRFQTDVKDRVIEVRELKTDLEKRKKDAQKKRDDLVEYRKELSDRQKIVESNQKQKNTLLAETKSKESEYKRILAEKEKKRLAFEQELSDYEAKLRITIDPRSLPSVGSGVLKWPLDQVLITQYFGNTSFATANPSFYKGKGHNGIDFRASVGTPVKASASGVVQATGNTDLVAGCYSYGKWILIKHNNGLSTIYAHLSLISVTQGQNVIVGDTIGYSGNTGLTTGPHLHFGVYATQGVQVVKYENSINCKGAYVPIADYKAYLNPLSYL